MKHLKSIHLFESEQFDLESEFNYLNKLLFDGKLEIVPLKWSNTKTRSGAMVGQRTVRGTGRHKVVVEEHIKHIEISKFYNKTLDQIRGILAHEMIHLYIFQQKIEDDGHHGHQFMRLLKEINGKGIINVPLKDDAADDIPTDTTDLKKPVVVFESNDLTRNAHLIALIDTSAFNPEVMESIISTIEYTSKVGKRDFDVKFYESTDSILKKFPVKKKVKYANDLKYVSMPENGVKASKNIYQGKVTGGKREK